MTNSSLITVSPHFVLDTQSHRVEERRDGNAKTKAGEHFTPRDVVALMADVIFLPIADDIESGTYLVYDGACGTGGMLTVAEERLAQLAEEHNKQVSIHLYGQEVTNKQVLRSTSGRRPVESMLCPRRHNVRSSSSASTGPG